MRSGAAGEPLGSIWFPELSGRAVILEGSYPGVQAKTSNNIAHSALDFRSVWSVHAGPTKGPTIWIELQPMLSPKPF
jgi:hypothetical protein